MRRLIYNGDEDGVVESGDFEMFDSQELDVDDELIDTLSQSDSLNLTKKDDVYDFEKEEETMRAKAIPNTRPKLHVQSDDDELYKVHKSKHLSYNRVYCTKRM